jgi:hypothetical protein
MEATSEGRVDGRVMDVVETGIGWEGCGSVEETEEEAG